MQVTLTTNVFHKGIAYTEGQTVDFSDEDGQSLVEQGFAQAATEGAANAAAPLVASPAVSESPDQSQTQSQQPAAPQAPVTPEAPAVPPQPAQQIPVQEAPTEPTAPAPQAPGQPSPEDISSTLDSIQ